jgi:hypothetical protein
VLAAFEEAYYAVAQPGSQRRVLDDNET